MKTIPLGHGKAAIVDDEDFEYLSQYRWFLQSTKELYVQRHNNEKKRGKIYMHREILRCLPGVMIDHINGNSLDNRKCNLRAATNSQNMANQPKQKRNLCRFKGICVDKKNGGWRAQISINGETKNLGHFLDDESAARAYNDAARKQFGEYARLNEFPDVARINKGTSSQKAKAEAV